MSGLTFRSLIHFEFIFVYGVTECSNFILLHVAGPVFPAPLTEEAVFSPLDTPATLLGLVLDSFPLSSILSFSSLLSSFSSLSLPLSPSLLPSLPLSLSLSFFSLFLNLQVPPRSTVITKLR